MQSTLAILALVLSFASGKQRQPAGSLNGASLTESYPFYHTSDSLAKEASDLVADCEGLQVTFESDGQISLPVARLPAQNGDGQLKVMMVFGEHARELIGPEAGLHFLQKLCSQRPAVRGNTSFVMVLNANPVGREEVEAGQYCVRTNEHQVDLNRNYGDHWKAERADDVEEGVGTKQGKAIEAFSSGTGPFSEPETQIIARLMKEVRPDVFLDVHSGTKGLFMPYDWTLQPIENEADRRGMETVLQEIKTQDCPDCMVGDGAETVGYLAPGSSADYAYSQGIAFSFIWEIYADAATVAEDIHDQQELLAAKAVSAGSSKFASSFAQLSRSNGFLSASTSGRSKNRYQDVDIPQWAATDVAALAPLENDALDHCFSMFNPQVKNVYDTTVERWSEAFLHLCSVVHRLKTVNLVTDGNAATSM